MGEHCTEHEPSRSAVLVRAYMCLSVGLLEELVEDRTPRARSMRPLIVQYGTRILGCFRAWIGLPVVVACSAYAKEPGHPIKGTGQVSSLAGVPHQGDSAEREEGWARMRRRDAPHAEEKERKRDVSVRHGVPAGERVLERLGETHERPENAMRQMDEQRAADSFDVFLLGDLDGMTVSETNLAVDGVCPRTHIGQGQSREARAEDALLGDGVAWQRVAHRTEDKRRDQTQKKITCSNRRHSKHIMSSRQSKVSDDNPQFPSCQMAMVVRGSMAAGMEVPSGMSSWWYQAAPGRHQAIMAGSTVDTVMRSCL